MLRRRPKALQPSLPEAYRQAERDFHRERNAQIYDQITVLEELDKSTMPAAEYLIRDLDRVSVEQRVEFLGLVLSAVAVQALLAAGEGGSLQEQAKRLYWHTIHGYGEGHLTDYSPGDLGVRAAHDAFVRLTGKVDRCSDSRAE